MIGSSKFGKRLRSLRKKAGMSQTQLGSLLGVSFTYISKIETSSVKPPVGMEFYLKLKALFELNSNEFAELLVVSHPELQTFINDTEVGPVRFYTALDELAKDVPELYEIATALVGLKRQQQQREIKLFRKLMKFFLDLMG